jgi:hypothetical protein
MSQTVKTILSEIIDEVLAERVSEDSINAIFDALGSKIKNPSEDKIAKVFTNMGVPYKFAIGLAKEFMKRHNVSEAELEETTSQGNVAGYSVPGAFSGTASRGKKDARDARIAHGTVAKQIHDKVDKLREGKISVGDSVHVKKGAPVLDKSFIGKLGLITYARGNSLNIEFPNGRTIALTTRDVEKAPDSVDESAKKYDIGMGYKGNGLTIWNRAEEEHGDYKTIAHVSDDGVVKFYDKNLPPAIKRRIEKEGDLMKKKSKNESLNESAEVAFSKSNFKKLASSSGGKGIVVFGTGGGYSDTSEFSMTGDALQQAIDKGKLDILASNAERNVRGARDPQMRGRKFMIRLDEGALNEASGAPDKKSFDMGARGYAKGLKAPSQDKSFMDYLKSTNNDATVGPFLKSWISGWTSAHIKDSNEILKKSGAFSPEELRAFPSMNEATYREFKGNPDLTTKQKIGLTIKEVNGALFKIERAIKQASKLKLERGVDPDNYWGSTRRQMNKISERILKIARELREMK